MILKAFLPKQNCFLFRIKQFIHKESKFVLIQVIQNLAENWSPKLVL
jgi:hypothetical protein